MTLHLLALLQAADVSAARDFGVYVADAAAIGAFGFAWRTSARLARIETILTERRSGVVDTVTDHGTTLTKHGERLGRHDERLDGHDDDINRIERRSGTPDRRTGSHDRRET